jgi:hypothetical protein
MLRLDFSRLFFTEGYVKKQTKTAIVLKIDDEMASNNQLQSCSNRISSIFYLILFYLQFIELRDALINYNLILRMQFKIKYYR